MPTEVVHSVGSGGDYATLAAWDTAQRRDLTAATGDDTIAVAEIIGGSNVGNGSTQVTISTGWTTDATNKIIIRAQAGSEYDGSGLLDTSKAYIQGNDISSGSFFNQGVVATTQFVDFERIQIDLRTKNRLAHCIFGTGGGAISIDQCLIRAYMTSAVPGNCEGINVEIRSPSGACAVKRSTLLVTYEGGTYFASQFFIQSNANGNQTSVAYNNTMIAIADGTVTGTKYIFDIRNSQTLTCQNNYLAKPSGTIGNIYTTSSAGVINKGANDATSNTEATTGSLQSIPYSTATFASVTVDAEDLTLAEGSALIDAGADLSGSGITEDMVGTAIPVGAAPDIGALEKLAGKDTEDGITVTEGTPEVSQGFGRTATESITVLEILSVLPLRDDTTETVTVSEDLDLVREVVLDFSESINVSETSEVGDGSNPELSETATASEAIALDRSVADTEAITVSEEIQIAIAKVLTFDEAIEISEAINQSAASAAEVIVATESYTVSLVVNASTLANIIGRSATLSLRGRTP